jgi:hypothetical protein
MSEARDDELRTGTVGRVALVAAVLLIVAGVSWWLWPSQRGEPELAHRVLIVGGTATDLVTPIAEAGFDADQRTWAQIESDVRELTGSFDHDALHEYADEQGYGFVAMMIGDDYPWAIEGEIPSDANAAVLCVGELCPGGLNAEFGVLPAGLDYAPAVRRSEALRLALYEHPDLLRLWQQPTPEQMQQQLQLGKLDDARTRLRSRIASYGAGLQAWPTQWPEDAITQSHTAVRGFPIPGALALQRTPLRLAVDDRFTTELVEGERDAVFVPLPVQRGPDPFADAQSFALPLLGKGVLSNNLRWLVAEDVERAAVHRFELEPGVVHDRGPVELPMFDHVELSDTGTLAWATDDGIDSELGPLRFENLQLTDFCWHGPDTLAFVLFDDSEGLEFPLPPLLIARPHADTGAPELLALSLADALTDHGGYIDPLGVWSTSTAGTFVVVSHDTPAGLSVENLIRVRLPSTALAKPSIDGSTIDPASIHAAMRPIAALRKLDGAVIEWLGIIPPFEQLEIAPDGSWAAWTTVGERGSIYAARIDDGRLGATTQLAQRSPPALEWHQRPRFLADSSALVLPAEQPWAFGVVPFLRIVARID